MVIVDEWPRFAGGSERISLSLARHARRHGHDLWLAYARDGDMVGAYARAGVHCAQVPVHPIAARRPVEAWRTVAGLRRVLRQSRADVMFTAQVPLVPAVAAATAWTETRSAVHLGLVYDFPSPIFQRGMRAIDVGVAPSSHTAEGWRDRGWPGTRLRVIQNGIDDQTFVPGDGRPAARERLGLPQGDPLLAYVGRLAAVKGIFTLLDAFTAYRRRGGRASLVMVGSPMTDEDDQLRRRARELGLADQAWRLWPATSVPEDVYRAADLVAVPSEWEEPFGLVPLEAAACGTLVVVSDRGCLPDFVRSIGPCAVVRAGDVDDWSTCLTYWMADDARREAAAERLAADVRARFSFAACGDAYLSAFAEIVGA